MKKEFIVGREYKVKAGRLKTIVTLGYQIKEDDVLLYSDEFGCAKWYAETDLGLITFEGSFKHDDLEMIYQVDDRVRVVDIDLAEDRQFLGEAGEILKIYEGTKYPYRVVFDNPDLIQGSSNFSSSALELLEENTCGKEEKLGGYPRSDWSVRAEYDPALFYREYPVFDETKNMPPKKKLMARLSNIAKRLIDADTKALVEAEYLDSDLELTEKGETEVLELVFFANKEALAKKAREELAEAKKKCK